MQFEKRRANTKQEIPTASMPDIVFMLLLFFMVTTTLREVDVLVDFKLPEAQAIEKLKIKDSCPMSGLGILEEFKLMTV